MVARGLTAPRTGTMAILYKISNLLSSTFCNRLHTTNSLHFRGKMVYFLAHL